MVIAAWTAGALCNMNAQEAMSEGTRLLRAMTYNVRYASNDDKGGRSWKQRVPLIKKGLGMWKPEILGVQEALHSQMIALRKMLPAHGVVGCGRDDGKQRGEYVGIFFDKSKWRADASQQGHFWFSNDPSKPGSKSWGNSVARMCTWVRLIDNHGAGVYVYNLHWDHRSKESREKSAELLLKRIQKRDYIDEPVVVLGDFNAGLGSESIKTLLAKEGMRGKLLIDSYASAFPDAIDPATFNHWESKVDGFGKIDHVFSSPSLKVKGAAIPLIAKGEQVGSDHHPVLIDFFWNGKRRAQDFTFRYIKEVLLDKEFGGGEGKVLRWQGPATIQVIGGNEEEIAKFHSVVDELNQALEPTKMRLRIAKAGEKADLNVYVGTVKDLEGEAQKLEIAPPENYAGYASITWNTQAGIIQKGTIFIATDRSPKKLIRHVFLEEITQALGLMGDNTVVPESVSFSRGNDHGEAPKLSGYDIKTLRLLYNHLRAGDNAMDIGAAYARFWGK